MLVCGSRFGSVRFGSVRFGRDEFGSVWCVLVVLCLCLWCVLVVLCLCGLIVSGECWYYCVCAFIVSKFVDFVVSGFVL